MKGSGVGRKLGEVGKSFPGGEDNLEQRVITRVYKMSGYINIWNNKLGELEFWGYFLSLLFFLHFFLHFFCWKNCKKVNKFDLIENVC
jgi:hypothetical protein